MRLPTANAAGTNSSDATEVQIGTGLTVPDWARSVRALHAHVTYLILTTKENVCGYIRLQNDNNTLDPMNFPLPLVTALTGAIGTHVVEDMVTVPCFHDVTPNDTVRAYAAFDNTTTGVHTLQAYVCFSSDSAPMQLHAQKSAVIAGSATANTEAGAATISTLADKTSALLGMWHYFTAYPTVDQTLGGYTKIESAVKDWQKQEIPTNMIPSGLSTQVTPLTKPVWCVIEELRKELSGYATLPFQVFPVKGKQDFNFSNYMDGTNTVAPAGRYGLIWRE